jgi:hypothetical protein
MIIKNTLALLALTSSLWAQPELSRYTLTVTANIADRKIEGHQTILFQNPFPYPIKHCYIRLSNHAQKPNPNIPNFAQDIGYTNGFEKSGIELKKITHKNTKLTYNFVDDPRKIQKFSTQETLCKITLPSTLNIGQSIPIDIDFTTKIPETYTPFVSNEKWTLDDTTILRFDWYPLEAAHTEKGWDFTSFAPQPHTLDTCSFTLPRGYALALSGDSVTGTQNTTHTTMISTFKNPITTVGVAYSKHFTQTSLTHNQTKILIYSPLPSHSKEINLIQNACIDALDTYTKKFGALQNQRLLIINSPFRGLWGMAANGFILLGDGAFSSSDILIPNALDRMIHYLVAHELGHLWAGIGTVTDFGSENVLSEGLTEYIATTHFEEKYGLKNNLYEANKTSLAQDIGTFFALGNPFGSYTLSDIAHMKYLKNVRDGFDAPVLQKQEDTLLNTRSIRDYNKGYLLFTTLENYIGKTSLEKGLHRYFTENKYSPVTIETLKNALQKETTRPLDPFFQKWFSESSQIDFSVKSTSPQSVTIQKTGDAPTGLDIELFFTDNQTKRYYIQETRPTMSITITGNQIIKGVILDPDSKVLETNKHNNKTINNIDLFALYNNDALYQRHPQENYFINFNLFSLYGTDSLTHEWILFPYFNKDTGFNIGGIYAWKLPKDQYTYITAFPNTSGWDLGIGYQLPLFAEVETGYYGHFLYPTSRIAIELQGNSVFSRLNYIDVKNGWLGETNLQWIPKNGELISKFSLATAIKLNPNLYLAPRISFFAATQKEDFILSNRGYGFDTIEQSNYLSEYALDLMFPILSNLPTTLFSSFKLRSVAGSIFIEGIQSWNKNGSPSSLHPAIGGELGFLFTTFADIPIPIAMGYVHFLSPKLFQASDTLYISLQTPLSLYALVFGH